MIVREAPPLSPEDAARRLARPGARAVWVSSPASAASPGRTPDTDGPGLPPADETEIAFDVVACDPVRTIRGTDVDEVAAVWAELRAAWSAGGEPPTSGLPLGVGWFSYELGHRFVLRRSPPAVALEWRFFDAVWLRSTRDGRARIFAQDEDSADRLQAALRQPALTRPPPDIGPLQSPQPSANFLAAVERIRDYLVAGEVYQVNLSRQLVADMTPGDPLWMAATLRQHSPAPHGFWMGETSDTPVAAGANLTDAYVVGNSPERFLHVSTDGRIETRPIKGTRPRARDIEADEAARLALTLSEKDRAEHVMIVDLERNDLGRICATGSIRVDEPLRTLALPTVFHLVSTVSGRLAMPIELSALLSATFPGGSITGAPKRRAMEIISELEPVPRGIYTGATGWLGASGDLDFAVAIRTAVVEGSRLRLGVGGGIVADSNADDELAETEVKARAFAAMCRRRA